MKKVIYLFYILVNTNYFILIVFVILFIHYLSTTLGFIVIIWEKE